ncbi:MAG: hypothetical protein QW607_07870 [Desulfurococcaceae archaeon]
MFSGLRNIENANEQDVLAKTASIWYYLTRITHQSIGSRIGSFAEEVIKYWIENSGRYSKEKSRYNVALSSALNTLGIKKNYKNKIDFWLITNHKKKKNNTNQTSELILVELRMSEHTGGRTGQESLMDKFNKILDMLISGELYSVLHKEKIGKIKLVIAILFNENQELIDRNTNNYNKGRLNSLISYIMEDNHIWGRIAKLSKSKYKYVFSDGTKIQKKTFESSLKIRNRVCLKSKVTGLHLELKILLGDEFFREIVGESFTNLVRKLGDIISDDLWIMYSLTINELKIAREFGETNVIRVYDICKKNQDTKNILNKFADYYLNYKKYFMTFEKYRTELNNLINTLAQTVLTQASSLGKELRLLEINDVVKSYNYLKYVCVAVLALYLTLDIKKDEDFKDCRWI